MNKEFIPYEQALELKELEFNEPCFGTWNGETLDMSLQIPSDDYFTKAPTFSQAFRWFRKKHFKMAYIYYDVEYKFCFCIGYNDKTKGFKSYEEAELACLQKLIEIVKQK